MRVMLLMLVLTPICCAQKFRFSQIDKNTVVGREQNVPATQEARRSRLREMFIQAGCTQGELTEERVENSEGVNVICRLPGKSTKTIVVGANYNPGIPDNWTASSLLPSLFQSLARRKRQHTFVFVAFADTNAGLAGSRSFVDQIGHPGLERTEAMVDLDLLGFSRTKISPNSDKDLVKAFFTVMYVLKEVASQVDISKDLRLDAETFTALNIPQITVHSLTQDDIAGLQAQTAAVVADPVFEATQFNANFYYSSYRLISGFLAYLDEIWKRKRR